MTTIAFKDGIMATDNRIGDGAGGQLSFAGNGKYFQKHGWTVGVAGDIRDHSIGLSILTENGIDKTNPSFNSTTSEVQYLCVRPDGSVEYVSKSEHSTHHIIDGGLSIGSGSEFASAAMDQGKSAIEAVQYAASRDPGTGGAVHWINVKTGESGKVAI